MKRLCQSSGWHVCFPLFLGAFIALVPAASARAQLQAPLAEGLVTVAPPLSLNGHQYVVQYTAEGPDQHSSAVILFDTTMETFERRRINKMVVTRDGEVVADADELADVFWAYTAAAYLYERGPDFDLGSIPSGFRDDLHRVTTNPVFLDQRLRAVLKGPERETLEALRAILAPRSAPSEVSALVKDAQSQVEDGQRVVDAVDDVIATMRWSESRSVRAIQREASRYFETWQPLAVAGSTYLDVGGTHIELLNGLDLIAFGLRLIALGDLSAERAGLLTAYLAIHAPLDGEFNDYQAAAAGKAVDEVAVAGEQEANVFHEFVHDEAIEIAGRAGEKIIAERAARWLASHVGLQFPVHRMVSAASAVGIGLTLGELLLGTGEMYSHMRVAERSDELRMRGRATRLAMQEEARRDASPAAFDGDRAMQYRAAYMLEALAAAQAHRSYADGVAAMVEPGLRQKLNPISWLKGEEWRAAVQGLRGIAAGEEAAAEAEMGHPDYVSAAVTLAVAGSSGGEGPKDRRPRHDPDAAARRLERAWRELAREVRRVGAGVAERLAEASRKLKNIVRGGTPAEPTDVARAYMEAVEQLDTGAVIKQFRPRDRLGMRLIHGATFAVMRGLGIEFHIASPTYELVETTGDTAVVRIFGTANIAIPLAGDEAESAEEFDEHLPLVREKGEWYVKGSDEINALLDDIIETFGGR